MFVAALASRSCSLPHGEQVQTRSRSVSAAFTARQALQVLLLG